MECHGDVRSELVESGLLEHPTRCAIYEVIGGYPGCNRNQLRSQLDLSLGVLDFHLGRLEDAGAIVRLPSARDNEVLLFWYEDRLLWNNPRTRVLFGSEFTRNVALYVAEFPGVTSRDIGDALGIEPVTVRYHTSILNDHNLIRSSRTGNQVRYEPSQNLWEWSQGTGQLFPTPWRDASLSRDPLQIGSAPVRESDGAPEQFRARTSWVDPTEIDPSSYNVP